MLTRISQEAQEKCHSRFQPIACCKRVQYYPNFQGKESDSDDQGTMSVPQSLSVLEAFNKSKEHLQKWMHQCQFI